MSIETSVQPSQPPVKPRMSTPRLVVLVVAATLGLAFTIVVSIVALNIWRSFETHPLAVPPYLQHTPGSLATRQARQLLTTASQPENCVTVRHDPNGLPAPYQRCAWVPGNGGPPQVDYSFHWNSDFSGPPPYLQGLSFTLGGTEPHEPDTCVRHLGGSWWAYTAPNEPQYVCPASFQFQGAP